MTFSFFFAAQECKPVKVINRDQWVNLHDFCCTIAPDLSNYDENAACTLFFPFSHVCNEPRRARAAGRVCRVEASAAADDDDHAGRRQ